MEMENMKITSISYRSLRTGHGYNNTACEATAAVGEGDDPDRVLAELRFWVDRQVDATLKREDAYESLQRVEDRVAYANQEADRLQKKIDAQREVIKEHEKIAALCEEHGLGGGALLLRTAG